MIRWNAVTGYSQVFAIFLAITIFYIGFLIGRFTLNETSTEVIANPVVSESITTKPDSKSLITFQGLEMTDIPLPPLPTPEEWDQVLHGSSIFEERYQEDAVKYGDIAKRYHSNPDYTNPYIDVKVMDVTSDGEHEQIISFSGGGSYGNDYYKIVAKETVIAIIDASSVGRGAELIANESGNGFDVVWFHEDMFPNGYCCPIARMVTRFVYQDGEFIAFSETVEKIFAE